MKYNDATLATVSARALLAALPLALLGACSNAVVCEPGELNYAGRPPPRLFAYDITGSDDCFSKQLSTDGSDRDCPEVSVTGRGALLDNRTIALLDTESLGGGRALLYSFGYIDEAGGKAPETWGFSDAGASVYLSDHVEGTARFDMATSVVEFAPDCSSGGCAGDLVCAHFGEVAYCTTAPTVCPSYDELLAGEPAACGMGRICGADSNGTAVCQIDGGVMALGKQWVGLRASTESVAAAPGRFEVHDINLSPGHLQGKFFLGYETTRGQPQGQVEGCFDLAVGAGEAQPDGTTLWLLGASAL